MVGAAMGNSKLMISAAVATGAILGIGSAVAGRFTCPPLHQGATDLRRPPDFLDRVLCWRQRWRWMEPLQCRRARLRRRADTPTSITAVTKAAA